MEHSSHKNFGSSKRLFQENEIVQQGSWFLRERLPRDIEKKLQLRKQNVKTNEWLGNLCKAVKTKL